MKRLLFALALTATLITSAPAQETRTFEAGNGGIKVPAHPLRIVSLHDLSITLPLVEFGATDRVAGSHGRVEEDKVPYIRGARELYETSYDNTQIKFIGVFNQIDLEVVAGLEPDLIIGRLGNDDELLPNLQKIAPTVLLDQDKLGFFGSMQAVADLAGVLPEYDRQYARYQAQIAEFRRLVPHPGDISVSILQPWPEDGYVAANREYYALSQVIADVGFSMPQVIAETKDSSIDLSPEFLPEVDADFVISTYEGLYPDQRSPDEIRAAFEKLVPGYCQVLTACKNNQMIFVHRTPIYSSSFRSLSTAQQILLTQIAGRGFIPFQK